MRKIVVLFSFLLFNAFATGQDIERAFQYLDNGQFELAAKEFESALPELERYYGRYDAEVYAKYVFYTASAYHRLGNYQQAEKYYLQAKTIYERKNINDNPLYGDLMNNLAHLYKEMGQYDKAISLFLEFTEITEKELGKEHPNYAINLYNLAVLYYSIGQSDKALPLFLKVLQFKMGVKSSTITCEEYENNFDKISCYESLFETLREKNNKETFEFFLIGNRLVELYLEINENEKLLEVSKELLVIIEKLTGKNNLNYITVLSNIAQSYLKKEDYENSLACFEELMTISKKLIDDNSEIDNPLISYKTFGNYVSLLNDYANLCLKMGDIVTAKELLEESYDISTDKLKKRNSDYPTILYNLANIYKRLNFEERALELFLEAESILKSYPNYSPQILIKVKSMLIEAFINNLDYKNAILRYYDIFMTIKSEYGSSDSSLVSYYNQLANIYADVGEYDQALFFYNEALTNAKSIFGENNFQYAIFLNNLASLYIDMRQFDIAWNYSTRAFDIFKLANVNTHPEYYSLLNNRAILSRRLMKHQEALSLYSEALVLIESLYGKNDHHYALILNNMSIAYSEIGDYENSLNSLINATEIDDNKVNFQKCLYNLMLIYNQIGLDDKAMEVLKNTLIWMKEKKIIDEATYNFYYYQTDNDFHNVESEEYLVKILEVIAKKNGKTNPDYVNTLYELIGIKLENFKLEEAKILSAEAFMLADLVWGKEHPNYGILLANNASIEGLCGDKDLALLLFKDALQIVENVYGKDHITYTAIIDRLVDFYAANKAYQEFVQLQHQAFTNHISFLTNAFTYLSDVDKQQVYNRIFGNFWSYNSYFVQFNEKYPSIANPAFNLELATKGMILKSGVQMRQAIINSDNDEILEKYDEWMILRSSLAKQYSLPLSQRSENIPKLEDETEKFESNLNKLSKSYRQTKFLGTITWEDIRAKLKQNEVAIEFSSFPYYNGKQWADSILYTANVLRRGDEHPHLVYLCEQRRLDSLLFQQGNTEPAFIAGLYRGAELIENSMPSNGHRLYELIWEPIAQLLPEGGTVYFAPSGSLHQIAHAAIPINEKTLLSDKYKLVQLSTTAVLLEADDQNETLTGEIALFGGIQYDMKEEELLSMSSHNSDINKILRQRSIPQDIERGSQTWSYLPGTLSEVETISKLAATQGINVKSYTGKEALEERFKALSGNNSPAILHIATHGFFFPDLEKELKNEDFMLMGEQQQVFRASENPLNRAGLLFAGANHAWQGDTVPEGVDDGILTAWEATNVTLTNTSLVTLSACETGLGEVRGSEGVFGLQRAFKAAGAGYLLMSLWKVPDKETAEFMANFYARLFEGTTITDAFHSTQQYMKTQYPVEPYKWAAFVLLR